MYLRFFMAALLTVAIGLYASEAPAARRYSKEIREHLKKIEKEKKQKEKEEARAARADKHKKLRPYWTMGEMEAVMDELLKEHPDLLSGGTYGTSVGGWDLRYIKLSTGGSGKPEILVSGNIHAHEMAAGQMVIGLLEYLAGKYGDDPTATWTCDSADIYFIPVLNPDGMAKAANMQSKWGVTTFIRKNANGVDLNRNFPYPGDAPARMKNSAGSPNKLSQTHRGPFPLSEPETAAIIRFIDERDILLSLNYHTTGGLILYPPGTEIEPTPDDELFKRLGDAYEAEQFDPYEVEPAMFLYPTLGDMDDYLYHRYGLLPFTVEVGTGAATRALQPHRGTLSPIFWAYNVYFLDQEKANNIHGAMAMIKVAVEIHQHPEWRKWTPPEDLWVGEPPPAPLP